MSVLFYCLNLEKVCQYKQDAYWGNNSITDFTVSTKALILHRTNVAILVLSLSTLPTNRPATKYPKSTEGSNINDSHRCFNSNKPVIARMTIAMVELKMKKADRAARNCEASLPDNRIAIGGPPIAAILPKIPETTPAPKRVFLFTGRLNLYRLRITATATMAAMDNPSMG